MSLRRIIALSLPALAAAAAIAIPASAQMEAAAPACSAPAPLPPELKSWRSPARATAGRAMRQAPILVPGRAVTLALGPTPQVTYPVRPAKPGEPASFGGLAGFVVPSAGTWRVALGSAAWVDVVRDGKAAMSVAHGHGPDCTGVRKMVDYRLEPGTYTLELAASRESMVTVLVTPLP